MDENLDNGFGHVCGRAILFVTAALGITNLTGLCVISWLRITELTWTIPTALLALGAILIVSLTSMSVKNIPHDNEYFC